MCKKHLSILIYSLAGGGAERVVSILLDELKVDYEITLVLMCDKIDYEIPKDIKMVFLENSNPYEHGIKKLFKLPLLAWRYKKLCESHNVDISLALMSRPSYIAILSKIFGNKVKNIISERTTPSMMYGKKNILSKVNKFLIKKLYPKADWIIANAEGNRLDLINNFAINPQKISTIPNLFDLKKIAMLSTTPVDDIDFTPFTFVTVGRLDQGKNHKLMINAFAKLENTSSQLLILGEGSEREALQVQIEALGLSKRVVLLGFDNNPYKYFSKSDVFVFSSNYEGFPNVIVEALACNLPVISTDCKSGPREILLAHSALEPQLKEGLEESDYGILFPVNGEKELVQAMNMMLNGWQSDKMKSRASDFDKPVIANKFREVLKKGLV
ncbi:MAG: Alpha-1,4-N-acetylgalactosamine transferase PglJ (EC [uncultured Sulfurovum sp.]|uniref:Alpha-1,4-N-acetylgalactosamine transferase PglJ (EC) n=1 Tax=uncultured Sulfurovum sp. TaxID=269237 RepID=A0A6S6S854_9BACT|nr:MAG: Alpha-1,4-N-acetylgalactosamine transferase PglJ (EC [uncultured Sulfurovum sp.]